MSGRLQITILGCGSSGGVPRVDGDWGACDPSEPKNRRRRCSILAERAESQAALEAGAATRVLVDTSPDLREQLLSTGGGLLDAVLYTHDHADQSHGVDDLRAIVYRRRQLIPAYMNEATRRSLTHRFSYIFETPEGSGYPPLVDPRSVSAGDVVSISGAGGVIEAEAFDAPHGNIVCAGWILGGGADGGGVAYTPDVSALDAGALERIASADVWIVDALRDRAHPSHATLEMALAWLAETKPALGVLTNMHVDLDYAATLARCPDGVRPAYDGLRLTLEASTGRLIHVDPS